MKTEILDIQNNYFFFYNDKNYEIKLELTNKKKHIQKKTNFPD